MKDLSYIDLMSIPGMTEARLRHLVQHFKRVEAIFDAAHAELVEQHGLDPALAHQLTHYQRTEPAAAALQRAGNLEVKIISCIDEDYPENLKGVPGAPPVLFIRGEIRPEDARAVGVIGTRKATSYGKAVADRLARDFAAAGVTVVSGLARGVDTQAHQSCLAAGGRTIAVMGTGIDRTYPPENRRLAERIIEHGALVTEFNFGTQPLAMNFPKRNRIISGLSLGIVAVEAKEASGVMNTVNWALNQGREVFAVPGNVFSKYSQGTNALIKAGASVALSSQTVLEELKLVKKEPRAAAIELELAAEESAVIALLSETPVYLDEIAARLEQPVPSVLNTLLTMELKGLIRQLPGKTFVRRYG